MSQCCDSSSLLWQFERQLKQTNHNGSHNTDSDDIEPISNEIW